MVLFMNEYWLIAGSLVIPPHTCAAGTVVFIVCGVTMQAATKKQKYEKISEKKLSTPIEVLCKVSTGVRSRLLWLLRCNQSSSGISPYLYRAPPATPGFPSGICNVSELLSGVAV